jgi:hypothetical protein
MLGLATLMFGQVGMDQTWNAKRPIELVMSLLFQFSADQFQGRLLEDT